MRELNITNDKKTCENYIFQKTQNSKYTKFLTFSPLRIIKDEKERKLYHIDQNHKENKASLSGLIFETEKALEDRLNIIKETKKNFRDKVRDLEYHIGELKITLDDLKLENKRNDQHIMGVINANNKSEYTYKCLSEEYKRSKHENDKLKNTNSNLK